MNRSGLHEYIDLMKKWEERAYLIDYKGYRKKTWTYRNVRSCILGLSRVLSKKNVQKGDRVILFGRPSPEWVVAFFAILHRGAAVVPIDHNTSQEFFEAVSNRTSPALVICENPPVELKVDTIPFSSIAKSVTTREAEPPEIEPDDTAEIVFTSGTTSDPKGVILTHANILSNLGPIEEGVKKKKKLIKLLTPFRIMCTVPYSHMFGQAAGIFLPILLGSTIYFTQETGPASIVRAIKRDRILTLIAVPRVLKLLSDYVKADLAARGKTALFERRWDRWVKLPYQIRVLFFMNIHRIFGLRFWSFIVGGAPLDPDTHEFWRRLVFSVFQGYGLTETAPMVTMFNPFRHNTGSVGKVVPGQEVKIGPDGEILVKGANVMAGYYNDPEGTASVMENGWFKTGDVGFIDKEGHVFIRGRKKDMIPTSDGHNVYPEDIEKVLNRTEGVREGIVIGMPKAGGETVHAVLLLDSGADPEKIIRKVNSTILPYQRIRGYSIWEDTDFPRTSTLKIRKAEVLKKITGTRESIPEDSGILDGLVAGSVSPDSKLISDLGMDSLDLVEAVSRIEKKYNVSIDESIIGPETTVKDLEKIASHPMSGRHVPIPRWARRRPVKLLRCVFINGLILPVFRLFCKIEVHGLENLNKVKGPRILAANHSSDLDPLAVLLSLPVKWRSLISPAMGLNRFHAYFRDYGRVSIEKSSSIKSGKKPPAGRKQRIKRFIYGSAYYLATFLFQTYPFPQGSAYRASLEYTGELLDAGQWILIFPEGEVSEKGEIKHFRGGISIIAEQTGSPIYPVGIKGMHRVMPPGKHLPRRGKVDVFIGKPLQYRGGGHEAFSRKAENAVKKLLL